MGAGVSKRDLIADWDEEAVVFAEDYYDDAIIGMTPDGNVVYDYDKLAEALMVHDKITWEEAVDWIEYNMICGGDRMPIIVYRLEEDE